jgi:hypothetical protein
VSVILFCPSGDAAYDACEGMSCQNRFHDTRCKRSQLQHPPDVAVVDYLLFGEVTELPRFQLLLAGVRFGQSGQQTAISEIALEGNRVVFIIGSDILSLVIGQSARDVVLSRPE